MTGAADLQLGCGHVPHGCTPQIPAGEGKRGRDKYLMKWSWPTCVSLLISALLTPPDPPPPAPRARQLLPNTEFDRCLPVKSCWSRTGRRAGSSNHIPTQPCTPWSTSGAWSQVKKQRWQNTMSSTGPCRAVPAAGAPGAPGHWSQRAKTDRPQVQCLHWPCHG